MAMIQQGVNQLLSMVGAAARLAPGYETKQQLYSLGKKEKVLELQSEALPKITKKAIKTGRGFVAQEHQRIAEEQAAIAQQKFELKPTKESMEKASFTFSESNRGQQRAVKKGQQQVRQRRNFISYLKNVELSGGGTVGDLPTQAQKAIAAQYSKKERKELMDRADMKGGNN